MITLNESENSPGKLVRKMVVAFLPNEHVLTTRLSNGAVVKGKNRAGYGGRGVFVYRDKIEREFEHIERFVEPGAVFVDIGANTGIYTMKVAKHLAGTGTVIAVEPFAEMAGQLASTVAANRFSNVRIRNYAVSDGFGPTDFWLNNDQPNSFSLNRYNATRKVSVFRVTLDQICDWEQIDRLDYIKVDAEGAEKRIVAGGSQSIQRYLPIIQVEGESIEMLRDFGYFECTAGGSNNIVYIHHKNSKLEEARRLNWKISR
jgi:FkbM family methyltransferase